jgi:pyruvate dehydrogenase E2 component (dihydrolipoamide acetyltransferase)
MRPITLPKIGLTMEEAKVVEWFKKEGDLVVAGDVLLEVETEKATAEIECPANGYLKKIVAAQGDIVSVAAVLAYLAETEEDLIADIVLRPTLADVKSAALGESHRGEDSTLLTPNRRGSGATPGDVRAAPAARKLARELNVNLSAVAGTGPQGRVLPSDIKTFVEQQSRDNLWEERRSSRLLLTRSVQTVPHINIAREIHAERLEKFKDANKNLTYTSILVRVLGQTLTEFDVFKSSIMGDMMHSVASINVGLVVDTEKEIKIPVLRDVDLKDLQTIAQEIKELGRKARANKLAHQEMQGATVSISNLGMYGVDFFTAIIPYGQSAILTVGRVHRRRVPESGGREVPYLWLNLVVDHRLIDGALAARCLDKMASYLESDNLFELV